MSLFSENVIPRGIIRRARERGGRRAEERSVGRRRGRGSGSRRVAVVVGWPPNLLCPSSLLAIQLGVTLSEQLEVTFLLNNNCPPESELTPRGGRLTPLGTESHRLPIARDIHEDQRVPPDAAPGAARRLREALPVRVGDAAVVGAGRPAPRGAVLQLDARRAALRRARRLRRRVHQRASPECLRLHAQSQHHGQPCSPRPPTTCPWPSCRWAPPCPRRTRPSAWPRSTPCSTASAAGASSPGCRWAVPWT